MVVNSDTPMLALYENGELIAVTQAPGEEHYIRVHRQLDPDELLRTRAELDRLWSSDFRTSYSLSDASDQTETKLFAATSRGPRVASIYGLEAPGEGEIPDENYSGGDAIPESLREIHRMLYRLSLVKSEPWEPRTYEVMAWAYDCAPEESVPWPADLPGLSEAVQRGVLHLLYIDRDRIGQVYDVLALRREKGAIEISGQKMAVSVRPVYPGEPIWKSAFRAAKQ